MKILITLITLLFSLNSISNEICTEEKINLVVKKHIEEKLYPILETATKKIYKKTLEVSLSVIKDDFEAGGLKHAISLYTLKIKKEKERKRSTVMGYVLVDIEQCDIPLGRDRLEIVDDKYVKTIIRAGILNF